MSHPIEVSISSDLQVQRIASHSPAICEKHQDHAPNVILIYHRPRVVKTSQLPKMIHDFEARPYRCEDSGVRVQVTNSE